MQLSRDKVEEVIGLMIITSVEPSRPPPGSTPKKRKAFMREREWIMKEFEKMADPEEQWSDVEYEWFINRILDHLGQMR